MWIFCVISRFRRVSIVRADIGTASDEELSAYIAEEPSEEACTELFHRYNKRIYLWCFNYTHDMEEAIDCAQEIFIKIFKNISKFSHLSRFSTWAYQVTRNHCLGRLTSKREQWWRRLQSIDDEWTFDKVEEETFKEVELEGDLERILRAADGIMKDDELEAFVLHYREGLAVDEITKVLGCENVTGARTLIQNARRKFRRLIKEKGFSNEK